MLVQRTWNRNEWKEGAWLIGRKVMSKQRIPVFRKDQKLSSLSGDQDAVRLDWLQRSKARVGWAYSNEWIVCDAAYHTMARHPDSVREAIDAAMEASGSDGKA